MQSEAAGNDRLAIIGEAVFATIRGGCGDPIPTAGDGGGGTLPESFATAGKFRVLVGDAKLKGSCVCLLTRGDNIVTGATGIADASKLALQDTGTESLPALSICGQSGDGTAAFTALLTGISVAGTCSPAAAMSSSLLLRQVSLKDVPGDGRTLGDISGFISSPHVTFGLK